MLAAIDTNTLVGIGAALGAAIAAFRSGRSKKAAGEAKRKAGEAKEAATEAKVASVDTKSAVVDAQASVLSAVQNFDSGTSAGLFHQVSILLERATTQLVRCETENVQLQALVKVLDRRVEANEREIVKLRASLTDIEDAASPTSRRSTRGKGT